MEALRPGDPGVVGRYRLSARLGQGRLGAVFLGKAKSGGPVAVRLVRPDLATDTRFMGRFRTIAGRVRTVDGPFLARVVDADPDGTPPWLATEYTAGVPLDAALRDHGPLPEPALRALGGALARALAAVHEAKVVHQGLSATTVMLTADGPRITDLGLPALLGVDAGASLPAPEQATGGTVTAATDVFALAGVVCAAAGVAPYGKAGASDIAQKVLRTTPELDDLPGDLPALIARCLARRPDARPTAAELVDLFEADAPEGTAWLPEAVAAAVTKAAKARPPKSRPTASANGTRKAAGSTVEDAPDRREAASASDADAPSDGKSSRSDGKPKVQPKSRTTARADTAANAEPKTRPTPKSEAEPEPESSPDETAKPKEPGARTTPAKPGTPPDGTAKPKTQPAPEPNARTIPESDAKPGTSADEDAKADEDGSEDTTSVATPLIPRQPDRSPGDAPRGAAAAAAEPAPADAATVPAKQPPADAPPQPLDQPRLLKPHEPTPPRPDTAPAAGASVAAAPAPAASEAAQASVASAPTALAPSVPAPRADAAPTVAAPRWSPAATPADQALTAPAELPVVAAPYAAPQTRPKREASAAVWYAVIVLVGLTSAGLAVYRLADSEWRDLQNPFMGMVLPGIALVCGLAGLLVLTLAVLDRRKAAGTPPGGPAEPGTAPPA